VDPLSLDYDMIKFMEQNLIKSAGNTKLKFTVKDPIRNFDVELAGNRGYSINEEMAEFLMKNPALEVKVTMTD
jgi:hypothetical protein